MYPSTQKLQKILKGFAKKRKTLTQQDWTHKSSSESWSKQEIMGHLIDSAMHNLRRFIAAHYIEMPFAIAEYEHQSLVIANHYQELSIDHISNLWCSLNQQIIEVFNRLSEEQLADEVINPDEFKYLSIQQLFEEYLTDTEEHLAQIFEN